MCRARSSRAQPHCALADRAAYEYAAHECARGRASLRESCRTRGLRQALRGLAPAAAHCSAALAADRIAAAKAAPRQPGGGTARRRLSTIGGARAPPRPGVTMPFKTSQFTDAKASPQLSAKAHHHDDESQTIQSSCHCSEPVAHLPVTSASFWQVP